MDSLQDGSPGVGQTTFLMISGATVGEVADKSRSETPRSAAADRTGETEALPDWLTPETDKHRPRRSRWWAVGVVVMTLALLGQGAYAARERLIDQPAVRAMLVRACKVLGCRLPLRQDMSRISLVSRDVRPHPSVDDALMITATIANQAPYPQAYPTLSLTLSDLDNRRLAMRRFPPKSYLADPDKVEKGMPASSMVSMTFEAIDPGTEAVSYEFALIPGRG